jgi:hypothetical protein
MAESAISLRSGSVELKSGSNLVGKTDRVYAIEGQGVVFDEVQVLGDLSGELEYNGKRLRIIQVESIVGLLVDAKGMRGPVWQKVECEIIA